MLELVGLIVECAAWEQRTPDNVPVPDESRAWLTIVVGAQRSQVWERFDEMEMNQRLVRIKTRLLEMTGGN